MLQFKPGLNPIELTMLKPQLLHVLGYVANLITEVYRKDAVITSILRVKGIDIGVHSTGRAVDVRSIDLTSAQILNVVSKVNSEFSRLDGKPTCIHHDIGLGMHFHLQVPATVCWNDSEFKISRYLEGRDGN
jgi:hypothetical protein